MSGKWLPVDEYYGRGPEDTGILWRKFKEGPDGPTEEFTEEEVRPFPRGYVTST